MHTFRSRVSRSWAFVVALAGTTASCAFQPSSLSSTDPPDGAVTPIPDADVGQPDADPGAPDASPRDGSITAPDASIVDAMAPVDGRLGCELWQPRPRHFDPCAIPTPDGVLILDRAGTYEYDTDTGILRAPDASTSVPRSTIVDGDPDVRLVSVEHLNISADARLRAVGTRPLLVASWTEILVAGEIDVSSSPASSGAGANTGVCNAGGTGGQNNGGGGGGGGGGLHGEGADGGDGAGGGDGGAKGRPVDSPVTIRGGCPGRNGGGGNAGNAAGTGGAGGGALQLTARFGVTINGRLLAGGAGGGGARGTSGPRCGGGGGGSGGLIGLEAPALAIGASAIIAANGGGGGEGSDDVDADAGDSGQPSASAAAGGSGLDPQGGDGGAGGARANVNGRVGLPGDRTGGPGSGGGGGGGGGAGYILFQGVSVVDPNATLSPSPESR